MIDYNSIESIVKDVIGEYATEENIHRALILTYKSWKKERIRAEQVSLRKYYSNKLICCERCGIETNNIEIHHKIPVELGGDNSKSNIRLLCSKCHNIENKETRVYNKSTLVNNKSSIIDDNKLINILNEIYNKDVKYYIIFYIAVNTGINVNDIAKFSIKDIMKLCSNNTIRTYNNTYIHVSKKFIDVLHEYSCNKNINDKAFSSRKSTSEYISRQQLDRVFKEACNKVGITDIHIVDLYKSFCYNYIKEYHDIDAIKQIMGFTSDEEVRQYLGVREI